MAYFFLITFLIFLPHYATPAIHDPEKPHIINLNQSLHATTGPTAWYSPSRRFAFGFLPQGGDSFLVGIWITDNIQNIMVWTANRDDPPAPSNSTIDLTADGKLLLNGAISIVDLPEPVAFASMLDSGNLVFYNQSSGAIWESFDFPTDTLLGGQKLAAGNQLVSRQSPSNFSTGRFCLVMQSDGNLVAFAYPSNSVDSYWASNTDDYWSARPDSTWNGFRYLFLDDAGRLKLGGVDPSRSSQLNGNYSGDTVATVYRMTLDQDGIFRVYSNASVKALWASMKDACEVKGFCGFNSYCTVVDLIPSCKCVPGTISHGETYDGCRQNFTKQMCRDGRAGISSYNVSTEKKLKWEDAPYFTGPVWSEGDCEKSCLEDCDCDAAEYDSNNCNKHKYPLRYVSRNDEKDSITFFKVGNRSFENGAGTPGTVTRRTIKKTNWKLILVMSSCLIAYSCLALVLFGVFMFKTRVVEYKRLLGNGITSGLAKELTVRLYSYKELKVATRGFREELGRGSFGAVYKGTVNSGAKLVAVKRLQKVVEEGEREFQSEMRVIGKTHHKNLVRLLGYCTEGSHRMLVYEYMSNGSLAGLIFHPERRPEWPERARIALDVAKGILYLHEECEAPIIHCDIKQQNILMDEFWNAKISDFGLAKLLMPDQTRTFTDARGTRGYLAPEWQKNLPISLKVDVYSYGVVLLELISCRKSIDVGISRPEEIQLSGWAYSCFAAGELSKLVGDEEIDRKSLERMVTVALWCIQTDPLLRPSMKGVVLMLEGLPAYPPLLVPLPNSAISLSEGV